MNSFLQNIPENAIEISCCYTYVAENGFYYVCIKPNQLVTVELIIEMVDAIGRLDHGKKRPQMVIADDVSVPDKKARDYMATAESNPYAIAEAFLIQSLPQRIMANFFFDIYQPARPMRYFTSHEEAEEWLKTFLP